jgi:hypothetical protein
MKCGREPTGEKVNENGICRAASEKFFNGTNSGKNGDRICFVVSGSFHSDDIHGIFAKKYASCKHCNFYKTL